MRVDADGADPGAATAAAAGSKDARARASFDEGLGAVAAGQFEAAVTAFETAYDLQPHPVTLFNLALALEKAQRHPEAWELFAAMAPVVNSDAEREEIRLHMDALETKVAVLEVVASPDDCLCIDGLSMPRPPPGRYRLALEPGAHTLTVDAQDLALELRAGERRVLVFDARSGEAHARPRGALGPAMLGTAIVTGAGATGLGVSAVLVEDQGLRTGLGVAAAASAGVALTASIVALLVETRKIRARPRRARASTGQRECPGSASLGSRLDLRLVPALERPPTLPATDPVAVRAVSAARATARRAPNPFPHPHSLQPERSANATRGDQKLPVNATP